jgi:ABC-type multidrug transport system fused ATPase/permease subunit
MLMGFRRFCYDCRNVVAVHWRMRRRFYFWFLAFVLVGICIGVMTVVNPLLTASKVNNSLLDVNILNVTKVSGIAGIIFGRVFEFVVFSAFVFLVCLHSWTALLCFPLLAFRGFSLVINIYWIIAKFGMFTGLGLLIVYVIILVGLIGLYACLALYIMGQCSQVRCCGFRGHKFREFFRCMFWFTVVFVAIALVEWVLYFLMFSKMIFLV